jgi:hypothetical protein
MTLEILRCPRHAKFWAVTVNDYRITPSKCCGAWSSVVRWKIDGRSLAAALRQALREGRRAREASRE